MRERAVNWSIVFASMGVANSLGAIMRQACFSLITERMVLRVRMAAFTTIMRQNIGWFDGSADHTVRTARAQIVTHLGRLAHATLLRRSAGGRARLPAVV